MNLTIVKKLSILDVGDSGYMSEHYGIAKIEPQQCILKLLRFSTPFRWKRPLKNVNF